MCYLYHVRDKMDMNGVSVVTCYGKHTLGIKIHISHTLGTKIHISDISLIHRSRWSDNKQVKFKLKFNPSDAE